MRRAHRPARDPEAVRRAFETGAYPYATRLTEKEYSARIMPLQVELLKAQSWIKATNERVTVLFEGATPPARAAPSSASWST